jgi:hypothetical protein
LKALAQCRHLQRLRKQVTFQIEQAEARQRSSKNPSNRKAAEEELEQLKFSVEMSAGEEQRCQVEQVEAEDSLRAEQAKMNELQDQLDRLDGVLAAQAAK